MGVAASGTRPSEGLPMTGKDHVAEAFCFLFVAALLAAKDKLVSVDHFSLTAGESQKRLMISDL